MEHGTWNMKLRSRPIRLLPLSTSSLVKTDALQRWGGWLPLYLLTVAGHARCLMHSGDTLLL
jgi:hypothetical protein